MKLGVMQPYVFPYIGYYQLIDSVDIFVFYDDVNFIKQGWVNRNRILVNGNSFMFSIPVSDISSYTKIKDVLISLRNYQQWRKKFFKSLKFNYAKALGYDETIDALESVLVECPKYLMDIIVPSVMSVVELFGIGTKIVYSSSYDNNRLSKERRLYDICKKEKCDCYVNSPGGKSLYSRDDFKKHEIDLEFISPEFLEYDQNLLNDFIPGLSIIDILMFNSNKDAKRILKSCKIVKD